MDVVTIADNPDIWLALAQALLDQVRSQVLVVVLVLPEVDLLVDLVPVEDLLVDLAPLLATSAEDPTTLPEIVKLKP